MKRWIQISWYVGSVLLLISSVQAQTNKIEESVVKIVNQYNVFNWYSPWDSGSTGKGTGSGFVVSNKRILTNAHVVNNSAIILVFFHNDPNPYPAKIKTIAHDCDLAVLELLNPKRLDHVPALEIAGLPKIRSQVFTYGYPAGGKRLSITRGVVSRIEMQQYVHTGVDQHLIVQTDAAINPGNSGGPVIQNGKVVGVAFEGNRQLENMGLFIPTTIIKHLFKDLEDGEYNGYPELGLITVAMENPAARAYAKMKPEESGIRIEMVVKKCSARDTLQKGDIITHINGNPIANDGTFEWNGLRLKYDFIVDQLQKGESVDVQIIRDGKSLTKSVKLNHYNPTKFQAQLFEQRPKYYIYAGLVFVPLNRNTLMTYGSTWFKNINQELLYEFYFRPIEKDELVDVPHVIQIRRLDDAVNAEESRFLYQIVDEVNGKKISTLKDLAEAFEQCTAPQHIIHFKYDNAITVLDRKKADAAHVKILKNYAIPKDRNL